MMLNHVSTDSQAPWKQRFRVATMVKSQIAANNPTRGIICSNMGGIFQLYAWDVPNGKLNQITHDVHGNLIGAISPNGRFIYTVHDLDGDQYGHFARLPFEGGILQDLTPGFPQYPLFQICLSELEDIVAGRNWLIEQDIGRSDAILITGWSYGGFLTLLALGKFPNLWAGGMAGYAIADWIAHYEEASLGVKMPSLFGGTPQEMPEQYLISSPITYAGQVQAPLLIYQGRNDPGCPPHQVERYINLLEALGKPVEVSWIDSGHGTLDTEQAIAIQELLLDFAYRILSKEQQ